MASTLLRRHKLGAISCHVDALVDPVFDLVGSLDLSQLCLFLVE